jgi:predicted nucleic acid-binding protein
VWNIWDATASCAPKPATAAVHAQAERLSRQRASKAGHRATDLLHLASAHTLGATDFLTFDQNQAELATVLGFTVKP